MERERNIIKFLLSFLVIFIIFSWYVRIGIVKERTVDYKEYLSFTEADNVISGKVNPNKNYYSKQTFVIKKTRGKIPFTWNKDTLHIGKKQYFSEEKQ